MNLEAMKASGEAPEWLTIEGLKTLERGYLMKDETPKAMYVRVSRAAASRLGKPDLEQKFFDIIWKNWLCLSTPVAANMGTDRGLPISCNSIHVGDSLDNILVKNHELGMLSKYGAGVGIYLGDLRARGSKVGGTGGMSDGVLAWSKIYDATIHSVNQGSTRRGAAAVFLPIDHGDIHEFINMRRVTADHNKRCLNLNHGVCVTDEFMKSLKDGHVANRKLWAEILLSRVETGEPYLFFTDNVNRQNPECYKLNGLKVAGTNICTEITLYTDDAHTFVCCLSSMNLARWDEWKDTDTVELAVMFLDAVLTEYIAKASNLRGFESAVRFAEKSRAIGIGALGWHSLLQSRMIPFDSFDAMMLNAQIFKKMRDDAERMSVRMADEYGVPDWCKGTNRRHTHLLAVAPTVSNSNISGGLSAGIEPWAANIFVEKSAKGVFIRKNKELQKLLETKGKNTDDVWNEINKDAGSVQNLKFLTDHERSVFLTAREINQFAIVRQAAQRQKYIDQAQSINLFFGTNSDPQYIHDVHFEAWESGIKTLYYCRSESVLRADLASRSKEDCEACSG